MDMGFACDVHGRPLGLATDRNEVNTLSENGYGGVDCAHVSRLLPRLLKSLGWQLLRQLCLVAAECETRWIAPDPPHPRSLSLRREDSVRAGGCIRGHGNVIGRLTAHVNADAYDQFHDDVD